MFMNMDNYEEVRIARDDEWAQYLSEGTNCDLVFYSGEVISVDPPLNMDLKVTQSDPAVKGNTAQGAMKPATLETGATIQVRFRWHSSALLHRGTVYKFVRKASCMGFLCPRLVSCIFFAQVDAAGTIREHQPIQTLPTH